MAVYIATSENEAKSSKTLELGANQTIPLTVKEAIKAYDTIRVMTDHGELDNDNYKNESIAVMNNDLKELVLGGEYAESQLVLENDATDGLVFTPYDSQNRVLPPDDDIRNADYFIIGDDSDNDSNGYTGKEFEVFIPSRYLGRPVKRIGKNAFRNSAVSHIKIGLGVETLSKSSFENSEEDSFLTTIEIPSSCRKRASESDLIFAGTAIHTFSVIHGTYEIAPKEFKNCQRLESVFIPGTVERIGAEAFADCISLKSITFQGVNPPILGSDVFPVELDAIYVHRDSVEKYRSENSWFKYASKIIGY